MNQRHLFYTLAASLICISACDSDYTLDTDTDPPLATPTAIPTPSLITPPVYTPTVTPPEPTPEWGNWFASLRVEPPIADLGTLKIQCDNEINLKVINDGSVPVKINNVLFTSSPEFSDISSTDDLYELAPAEEGNIWVSALGLSEGEDNIELWIMSPGEQLPAAKVPVVANTYNGMIQQVDTYYQEPSNKVDVLWVIDNSGSMSSEQKELANNFTAFMDGFVRLGIEYHMGVSTTDMFSPIYSGRLQGDFGPDEDKPYIDWTMREQGVDDFTQAIERLGTGGSGQEQGLDSMYAGLTEPLVSGDNAGFFREDAFLSVIFVSDEEDQSILAQGTTAAYPQNFVNFLTDLKGGPENVVASAVLRVFDGTGYANVAKTTGGVVYSIAVPYGEILAEISWLSAGYKSSYTVTQVPAPSADIVVEVNDVVIPPGPETWSYDNEYKLVVFAEEAIPEDGSKIDIIYWLATPCDE